MPKLPDAAMARIPRGPHPGQRAVHHVQVSDDASIETAPTYPVPLRERFRWHPLDGLVAASVPIGGQATIEVDWSRLGWWRARRRLRRRYGIVASQLDGSTWLLRDERSVRRPTLRVTSRCTAHRPD